MGRPHPSPPRAGRAVSAEPRCGRLELTMPAELIEAIAERAAAILLERLRHEAETPPRMLKVPEAAAFLRAEPQRVYDLLSDGRLTRHKDGRRVLVDRQELEGYLAGNRRGRHL
jgi:excisionase family DNA binding protein